MQSKYFEKLQTLDKEGIIKVMGNRLLVEVLEETEKKTASGIVISQPNKKNPLVNNDLAIVKVLAVGEGYFAEDKDGNIKDVGLTNKPGDNILVSTMSLTLYSDFFLLKDYKEGTIGLIGQENVHATITDVDKFLEVLKN